MKPSEKMVKFGENWWIFLIIILVFLEHKLVFYEIFSVSQPTHFFHRGDSDLSQSFTWKFQVEIKSILLRIFKVKERVKMFWQITFAPEGVSSNSALFFSLRLRQLRQFKNYLRHTSSSFRAWYNKKIFLQQYKIREPDGKSLLEIFNIQFYSLFKSGFDLLISACTKILGYFQILVPSSINPNFPASKTLSLSFLAVPKLGPLNVRKIWLISGGRWGGKFLVELTLSCFPYYQPVSWDQKSTLLYTSDSMG